MENGMAGENILKMGGAGLGQARLGVARTAGSDAHDAERLMTCYTELPDPVRSTADLVDAIKSGATIPHRRVAPGRRQRRLGIF